MYKVADEQDEIVQREIAEEKRRMGERLRKARKRAKKSQGDAADLLDTTQQQISKYENGEDLASAIVIRKLAEFYEVKSDFILSLTENPTEELPSRKRPELIDNLADAIAKNKPGEAAEIFARLLQRKD